MGGSVDNEFVKLAWRRENPELNKLAHYQFGDTTGALVDQLGIREKTEGVALRATFIVDPDNVIQHASANNLNLVPNPKESLDIPKGFKTESLSPSTRAGAGDTVYNTIHRLGQPPRETRSGK